MRPNSSFLEQVNSNPIQKPENCTRKTVTVNLFLWEEADDFDTTWQMMLLVEGWKQVAGEAKGEDYLFKLF